LFRQPKTWIDSYPLVLRQQEIGVPSERASRRCPRQIFGLTGFHLLLLAATSRRPASSVIVRLSFPFTAARQFRILTGFPAAGLDRPPGTPDHKVRSRERTTPGNAGPGIPGP